MNELRFTYKNGNWDLYNQVNDSPVTVTAPRVHYFKFTFKSAERMRFSRHHDGIHSYTLISPELNDTLVGQDADGNVQEIVVLVDSFDSPKFEEYLTLPSLKIIRDMNWVLRNHGF